MALQDYFDSLIAYNPDAGELVSGATFQVYAVDDSAFATPLAVTEPTSGASIGTLTSSSIGVLPDFRVAGDPAQVILKSGAFATKLTSRLGVLTEAGFDPDQVAAAVAAVPVAEAARDAALEAAATAAGVAGPIARVAARSAIPRSIPTLSAFPAVKATDLPTVTLTYADGASANTSPISGTLRKYAHDTNRVYFWGMLPKDEIYSGSSWHRRNQINNTLGSTWAASVEYDGQDIVLGLRAGVTSIMYWVWVDDQPLTADPVLVTSLSAGATYRLYLAFASAAHRRIRVHVSATTSFRYVEVPVTATIVAGQRPAARALCGFDSLTNGALGLNDMQTWPLRFAAMLGLELFSIGAGGRGYSQNDAGGTAKMSDTALLDRIVEARPEFVVLVGSVNDRLNTQSNPANVLAAAKTVFNRIRTDLPQTQLIVFGPQQTGAGELTDAAQRTNNSLIHQAAVESGAKAFIDILGTDVHTVAWATAKAWALGCTTIYQGGVYRCIEAHVSGSTFDERYWAQIGLLTGTGYSGITAGNGNRDVLIGSDNVHYLTRAHKLMASLYAAEFLKALATEGMYDTYQLSTVRPAADDPTPPAAVVLSGVSSGATSTQLTWTASPTATLYKVQRRSSSNGGTTWGGWAQATTTNPPTVTSNQTGLTSGWLYEHRIVPNNIAGDGPASNVVQFAVP